MTVYEWNPDLAPRGISFTRRGASVGGPPSFSGRSQVGEVDAGYWMAKLNTVNAGGKANVLAFRRQFGRQQGGAHQILVPVFDRANAPWVTAGVYAASTTYSDGTIYTDGTSYADPVIIVSLTSAAARRATQITPTVTSAGTISGGEYFSAGVHLYTIDEVNDDGTWTIWPPLREALASGYELNFDNPKCLMRLLNEGDDDLLLERGGYGFPDLTFIEDLST